MDCRDKVNTAFFTSSRFLETALLKRWLFQLLHLLLFRRQGYIKLSKLFCSHLYFHAGVEQLPDWSTDALKWKTQKIMS